MAENSHAGSARVRDAGRALAEASRPSGEGRLAGRTEVKLPGRMIEAAGRGG